MSAKPDPSSVRSACARSYRPVGMMIRLCCRELVLLVKRNRAAGSRPIGQ
jgi:hypothetical protein